MERQEIEIAIKPGGEVQVHIKGVKGPQCMKYAEWLQSLVGEIKELNHTHEFYEPETPAQIDLQARQHLRHGQE